MRIQTLSTGNIFLGSFLSTVYHDFAGRLAWPASWDSAFFPRLRCSTLRVGAPAVPRMENGSERMVQHTIWLTVTDTGILVEKLCAIGVLLIEQRSVAYDRRLL